MLFRLKQFLPLLSAAFIMWSMAACTGPESTKAPADFVERVEPVLHGNVYPVVDEIIEDGKLIGFGLKIAVSQDLETSVECRMRFENSDGDPIPAHVFGGGLPEDPERSFLLEPGNGYFPSVFMEHPSSLFRISLDLGQGKRILLYQEGDARGRMFNWAKPDEFDYR